MKIALPLNHRSSFYHNNPFTAPKFGIYTITSIKDNTTYSLHKIIDNPWNCTNEGKYKKCQITCSCKAGAASDIHHVIEHYAMLPEVSDCDYFLANRYCKNTSDALTNAGIDIYKIPPFIHTTDMAIKNFVLGVCLASTFQHIHHAS